MSRTNEDGGPRRDPWRRWALVSGTLVDPLRRSAVHGGILIEDGRIVAAGSDVRADGLSDTHLVDVAGMFVMPGLIDTHLHLSFDGGPRPIERFIADGVDAGFNDRLAAAALAALRSGVTTIRDLGGPDREIFDLRGALLRGAVQGPRLIASGRVLVRQGGHCHFIGRPTESGTSLSLAVRSQLDADADVIKVMVTGGVHTPGSSSADVYYQLNDLSAAAEVAHESGRQITGHATNPTGIERTIMAGFDSVQHGSALDGRLASRMAERGVRLVPTMGTHAAMAEHHRDPRIPAYVAAKAAQGSPGKTRALQAAIEAGVTIVAGTDGGVTFVGHDAMTGELRLLRQAGLSPMETLAAATSTAAVEVGLGDTIGCLATGYVADLIVLRGDPIADLNALDDPHMVISSGDIVASESGTRTAQVEAI